MIRDQRQHLKSLLKRASVKPTVETKPKRSTPLRKVGVDDVCAAIQPDGRYLGSDERAFFCGFNGIVIGIVAKRISLLV
jgi:hypothetical protein